MGLLLLLTLSAFTFSFESGFGTDKELFLFCLPSELLIMLLCPNQHELLCACMFGYYLCLSQEW